MTGVILINFGGPRTTEEIEPFLLDILKDVLPRPLKPFAGLFAKLRLPRSKKMYDAIGGASPVVGWTTKQAQALENKLNGLVGEGLCPLPELRAATAGRPYKIYIAMKYGKPSINEAVAAAKNDGCEKIVFLPLFLYHSKYTDRAMSPYDQNYIRCMVDIIRSSLAAWRDIPPPQVTLLFTAHSIPTCSAKNDPYVRQINDSISKIMGHFTGYNYQIAYQSAPFKFGWLGPDVKSAIRLNARDSSATPLADRRFRGNDQPYLIIIPLGFACENLETLYELDQLYLPFAKGLGLNVKRAPALNDNLIFIDLLAEMVLEKRSRSSRL